MKKLIFSAASMLSAFMINAQTTATNWSAQDCKNVSHTLFDELNSGKVIVLDWVMPCPACVGPSKAAYNAVQSFATSHPGKVLLYMADDYGDANCATLENWVTANTIGDVSKITFFDNAGEAIDMSDFGGDGMPKVVVMGGPNHQIFFNKNDGAANDGTGITNAITAAIAATNVSMAPELVNFTVAVDPVTGGFTINYGRAVKKITIAALMAR